MGKASSAKKVARLAERGKGKKIRFQGGSTFPIIIAVIVLLGVSLVAYSRQQSRADAAGPDLGTHWHLVYGIYLCDKYLDPFQDNKESSDAYQELQIHSHGDGVMHWHPSNERAINRSTGRKATLDVFLGLYGVTLTDKKLTISGSELTPPGDDQVYEEGSTTCTVNGKEEKASLRVKVWDRYDQPGYVVRTSSLGKERIIKDQQVFVVAFVPDSIGNANLARASTQCVSACGCPSMYSKRGCRARPASSSVTATTPASPPTACGGASARTRAVTSGSVATAWSASTARASPSSAPIRASPATSRRSQIGRAHV